MACILLNPSVADEAADDPTLARCTDRAQAMGFGGLTVVNLFALVSPDPRALRAAPDPVGPGADAALEAVAGFVLCGWGNHGRLAGRGEAVAARLRARGVALHNLGLTRHGQPRHPLYVAGAVAPRVWEGHA
jgi:hypothetical protein